MRPSAISFTIFIITIPISVQSSATCDFFLDDDIDLTCFINQTAITSPETLIQPKNHSDSNILWISGPSINFLPIKIAQSFQKLTFYGAKNGNFQKVEQKNLKNMKNLTFLVLKSESLEEVTKDAFDDLHNLKFLDLADSSIMYFHSATFKALAKLKYLYIQHNQLQVIHPTTFDSLASLEIVSFMSNNLMTLNRQLFVGKNRLRTIDGRNNKFVYLSETTFDGLKLEALKLSGGDGCQLYDYGKYENGFIDTEEIRRDLRDDCAGSDFKVYEMHAKTIEIFGRFGEAGQ